MSSKLCGGVMALLLCVALVGCKSSGEKKEDTMPPTDDEKTTQQRLTLDEAASIPPEQRTFNDDMVIICYAPQKATATDDVSERARQTADYISMNIYTPEAVEFLQSMSTMEPADREAHFDRAMTRAGLTECPLREEMARDLEAADAPAVDGEDELPMEGEDDDSPTVNEDQEVEP